jgi:ABC-2 type transport system permease protein
MYMESRGNELRNSIAFTKALFATSLKASMSLRGAFLLQAFFMIGNNLIFFSIWIIIFRTFQEIRGWHLTDMALLLGVVASSFGLSIVLGGGVRNLSRMIFDGELDSFMTQPKSILIYIIGSNSVASGWGDLLTGLLLISLSGYVRLMDGFFLAAVLIACTTVILATGIIIHSLAFWLGSIDTLAKQLNEFIITFSTYPKGLFSGPMRVILFSILPAGFIGYLPAELLKHFTFIKFITVILSSLFYAILSIGIFHFGLRRYNSGNQWTIWS